MAAQRGKDTLLYADLAGGSPQNFTLMPGLRDTNWSVNGEQVDVTNKDSSAWRQLLTGAGGAPHRFARGSRDHKHGAAMVRIVSAGEVRALKILGAPDNGRKS